MTEILVLDASALCKLLRREPESETVQTKVRRHLEDGGAVWTDPIAALEVVTCVRKAIEAGEGTLGQMADAMQDALALVTPVSRTHKDMSGLVDLACTTGLTGPDARYVELALGNRLLTFDSRQADAARKLGIRLV